jgi:hypothetical protein
MDLPINVPPPHLAHHSSSLPVRGTRRGMGGEVEGGGSEKESVGEREEGVRMEGECRGEMEKAETWREWEGGQVRSRRKRGTGYIG